MNNKRRQISQDVKKKKKNQISERGHRNITFRWPRSEPDDLSLQQSKRDRDRDRERERENKKNTHTWNRRSCKQLDNSKFC